MRLFLFMGLIAFLTGCASTVTTLRTLEASDSSPPEWANPSRPQFTKSEDGIEQRFFVGMAIAPGATSSISACLNMSLLKAESAPLDHLAQSFYDSNQTGETLSENPESKRVMNATRTLRPYLRKLKVVSHYFARVIPPTADPEDRSNSRTELRCFTLVSVPESEIKRAEEAMLKKPETQVPTTALRQDSE